PRLVVRPRTDVRRLVSGPEQVLHGTRRGATGPEQATGTGYSGTAAGDRLVGGTNGAGTRGLAGQAVGAG
ncbi:histidinol-phosphate aminotransferase family protein, partial [Streptomyces sp. TRM76130]|nr:histidinol-phosphate aminotransferase family protein [Streptomyces sp. TRM76130]